MKKMNWSAAAVAVLLLLLVSEEATVIFHWLVSGTWPKALAAAGHWFKLLALLHATTV